MLSTMFESLSHYISIMNSIQKEGEVHLDALHDMRSTCAFQSEITSGEVDLKVKEYYE